MRVVLLILFLPLITLGQKKCEGIVVDKSTGNKIPFATVALVKSNKGVSANEHGRFSIYSSMKEDSILITSVGYVPVLYAVSKWINGTTVALEQRATNLREVIVSTREKKQIHPINQFGNCSLNWYYIGFETMYQLAQRFDAPEEGMRLSELAICKDATASIFRIRIYDVDSTCNCPSRDLVDSVIEVRSTDSRVNLNLEKFDVVIPGKSFFVAIEWVFIQSNEERQKIKRGNKKVEQVFYRPALRFVKRNQPNRIWLLNFNGRWTEISSYEKDYNFQISPKMR